MHNDGFGYMCPPCRPDNAILLIRIAGPERLVPQTTDSDTFLNNKSTERLCIYALRHEWKVLVFLSYVQRWYELFLPTIDNYEDRGRNCPKLPATKKDPASCIIAGAMAMATLSVI